MFENSYDAFFDINMTRKIVKNTDKTISQSVGILAQLK